MTTLSPPASTPVLRASQPIWWLLNAGGWSFSSIIAAFVTALLNLVIANLVPVDNLYLVVWSLGFVRFSSRLVVTSVLSGIVLGLANGTLQLPFLRAHHIPFRRWLIVTTPGWTLINVLYEMWRLEVYQPRTASANPFSIVSVLVVLSLTVLSVTYWIGLRRTFAPVRTWVAAGVAGYGVVALLSVGYAALTFAALSR